jgi:hypothetical protein
MAEVSIGEDTPDREREREQEAKLHWLQQKKHGEIAASAECRRTGRRRPELDREGGGDLGIVGGDFVQGREPETDREKRTGSSRARLVFCSLFWALCAGAGRSGSYGAMQKPTRMFHLVTHNENSKAQERNLTG